jgi:hypothetical protein
MGGDKEEGDSGLFRVFGVFRGGFSVLKTNAAEINADAKGKAKTGGH